MIQPITVSVSRELGNAGDCIVTIRDAAGEERKLSAPGDCTPYSALHAIREGIEALLNEQTEPPAVQLAAQPTNAGDA